MREILFRGKRMDMDNSEWIEGSLWQINGQAIITRDGVKLYKVIPETVGQYTGFDDKNGKKIFEGDIVVTNKFRTPEVKYGVVYDKEIAAYIGTYKKGYVKHFTTFSNDGDEFEVIGSVYDGGLNDGKHSAEN